MSLDRLAHGALSRLDTGRASASDAGAEARLPERLPPGRFRTLFRNAPIAILFVDARGRILEGNDRAVRLSRWSKDELRRTTLHALVARNGHGAAEAPPCQWEGRLEDAEGRLRAVRVVEGRPLDSLTGPRPCYLYDVEADRLDEERFRATEAVTAIATFAGGLAHELGNRLTALVGHLELLRTRIDEPSAAAERLSGADAAAAGLTELVRGLQGLTVRDTPRPEIVDLASLLRGVERRLRDQLSPTVHLEVDTDPPAPAVRADPRLIERALIEIAGASRRSMPRGGRLRIEVDPHARRGRVEMRIRDTGARLEPGRRREAFVPLAHIRAGGETAGLSLALARAWLLRAGVDVEASEGEERGLVLHLRIPVAGL